MSWSRRRVVKTGGLLAAASAVGVLIRPAHGRGQDSDALKRITLKNLHTPESLDIAFRHGEAYVPDALAAIQVLLRDYRTGEQHPIDPALLDYLYDVAQTVGVAPVFSVISGYRSPQTNAMLHERSGEVAKHSLHLEGMAIDIRLTDVSLNHLHAAALSLGGGGVGYYPESDFVHIDVGPVRTWSGT